ncbi:unnamed protein product [Peronospora belbahrii]|uniref:Uncharacterized protein n=1 Tax=Peronospora belbahrii TaxID=622444 RepID=A0ABN8CQU4_9STRA|nr:unnamed protein product [Peronospora belbahrii]
MSITEEKPSASFELVPSSLFVPKDSDRFILNATGKYVKHDVVTGMYISTRAAILPATYDNKKKNKNIGRPYVVLSDEEDISGKLKRNAVITPVYTLRAGLAWEETSEMTSMFCFDNAIVEYRDNIGIPAPSANSLTGVKSCYMETYASVGIPLARYHWLLAMLRSTGVNVASSERDQEFSDYVWTNANITKNYHPVALIETEGGLDSYGDADKNLMHIIRQAKSNVIGVVGVEITLKRGKDYAASGIRRVTLSLKSMQVHDLTTIRSPPLNRALVFESSGTKASKRLIEALQPKNRDISSAQAPKK